MENTTAFDLNNAIDCWRERLSHSPQFREENLAELESHLRDAVTDLEARGLTSEEAYLLAARRLGNPASLEPEFAKVNRGQLWLRRLLWMLVGIQGWGLIITISRLAGDAAMFGGLVGFGSAFPQGYPLSNGGVIATALFALVQLLALAGCAMICWWFVRRKEDAVHDAAVKALRRPVVLGLVVMVLLLLLSSASFAIYPLMAKLYPPETFGRVAMVRSVASLILSPVQTLALVVLTIAVFRRRLRLSRI